MHFNLVVPGIPYQVRVTAFSHEEMGVENNFVVFFSKELSPAKTPDDIEFTRLSPTSINVTWTPLSLFEAQGFPIYKVTLIPTSTEFRTKRQSSSSVLVTENNFAVFTNLKSDQEYSLTVGVTTDASSDFTSSQPTKGIQYALLKALPVVCMKYTAQGESQVANIVQGKTECYICHETLTNYGLLYF